MNKIEKHLGVKKPMIGMLHLSGVGKREMLDIARRELSIMQEAGIDAVMIENYFGGIDDVELVLQTVVPEIKDLKHGINILGNYDIAYRFAKEYGVDFIQMDSVAGHLSKAEDSYFAERLANLRSETPTFLMGGVRFKYQPYLSGRTLAEDLQIAKSRCDAVVVTGNGTGMETDLKKIKEFREELGDFSLVVGAGLTLDNCEEQLMIADAGIVGSYLKEGHTDMGVVDYENTQIFMSRVRKIRKVI